LHKNSSYAFFLQKNTDTLKTLPFYSENLTQKVIKRSKRPVSPIPNSGQSRSMAKKIINWHGNKNRNNG